MDILVITEQQRHYERIVGELRKKNRVDHIFRGDSYRIENGDYQLPRLLGRHRGFLLLAFLWTNRLLLRNRYDIVLTDYKSPWFPFPFLFIKERILDIHPIFIYDIRTIPVDYGEEAARKVERQFSRHLKFAEKYYQGITIITEEMEGYLRKKYLDFRKPVGIWESGVDTARFRPVSRNTPLMLGEGFERGDFICFYHGSVNRRRGILELVEAFRWIREREPRIKLFILGTGDAFDGVERMIERHGLEGTVRLKGWVDYAKVPEYISFSNLCVIPLDDIDWWRVSSPLKLMEYIACGKNILLTRIKAHTNVVGWSDRYFWVDEFSPRAFAEKIEEAYRRWKEDPEGFRHDGIAEREKFIEGISWQERSATLNRYFTELSTRQARS